MELLSMGLLYGIVGILIIVIIAIFPIFPFWKVWQRLKNNNRDLWNGMGPFDFFSLITEGSTQTSFLRIINKADKQKDLIKRDPELIKWTKVCKALIEVLPRGFLGQVFIIFILLFIVTSFTSAIINLINIFL